MHDVYYKIEKCLQKTVTGVVTSCDYFFMTGDCKINIIFTNSMIVFVFLYNSSNLSYNNEITKSDNFNVRYS